jgi:hypothetical protein
VNVDPKATGARLHLPTDDATQEHRYTMPDPDALAESYERLYHAAWLGQPMDCADVKAVLALASGYLHLTTYDLGQECCVGQLRDIWRARRMREGAP